MGKEGHSSDVVAASSFCHLLNLHIKIVKGLGSSHTFSVKDRLNKHPHGPFNDKHVHSFIDQGKVESKINNAL